MPPRCHRAMWRTNERGQKPPPCLSSPCSSSSSSASALSPPCPSPCSPSWVVDVVDVRGVDVAARCGGQAGCRRGRFRRGHVIRVVVWLGPTSPSRGEGRGRGGEVGTRGVDVAWWIRGGWAWRRGGGGWGVGEGAGWRGGAGEWGGG